MTNNESEISDGNIQNIVDQFKSRGLFDEYRHEALNEIESKPFTLTVKHQVEESVMNYLTGIRWTYALNKNEIRNKLRTEVLQSDVIHDSVKVLVNHTLNMGLQAEFSLKIFKMLEKFFIYELKVPEAVFYNTSNIEKEHDNIPPLPPSPPPQDGSAPPLPPPPTNVIQTYDNNDVKPSFEDLRPDLVNEETEPANALEALDIIKNKLAQLFNAGTLDFNNIDLGLNLPVLHSDPQTVVVDQSNISVTERMSDDTTKTVVKSEKDDSPKIIKEMCSLKEEIEKTVESAEKRKAVSISHTKSSTLYIDKDDISVSSVHTSDLSTLDDQISISSSDLPEMDESLFPIANRSDDQIEDKPVYKPTILMQYTYNYLLGGAMYSTRAEVKEYYQNIIDVGLALQEKVLKKQRIKSNSSQGTLDEDLLEDLNDHCSDNYAKYTLFQNTDDSSGRGCVRALNTPKKAPCVILDRNKLANFGKFATASDDEGGALEIPTCSSGRNSKYNTPDRVLYKSHGTKKHWHEAEKVATSIEKGQSTRHHYIKDESEQLVSRNDRCTSTYNYRFKGHEQRTTLPDDYSKEISFDEFYKMRAQIKPATPSSAKKKTKQLDNDGDISKTGILPTQKVRQHMNQVLLSKHSQNICASHNPKTDSERTPDPVLFHRETSIKRKFVQTHSQSASTERSLDPNKDDISGREHKINQSRKRSPSPQTVNLRTSNNSRERENNPLPGHRYSNSPSNDNMKLQASTFFDNQSSSSENKRKSTSHEKEKPRHKRESLVKEYYYNEDGEISPYMYGMDDGTQKQSDTNIKFSKKDTTTKHSKDSKRKKHRPSSERRSHSKSKLSDKAATSASPTEIKGKYHDDSHQYHNQNKNSVHDSAALPTPTDPYSPTVNALGICEEMYETVDDSPITIGSETDFQHQQPTSESEPKTAQTLNSPKFLQDTKDTQWADSFNTFDNHEFAETKGGPEIDYSKSMHEYHHKKFHSSSYIHHLQQPHDPTTTTLSIQGGEGSVKSSANSSQIHSPSYSSVHE